MKRKVLIGVLVFIAIVLVALALIIPRLVDLEQYRPVIELKLKEVLRKDVRLGELDLRILPRPAVRVYDVAIYDERPEDALFSVEALDIAPRLLPLLRKRVEVKSVKALRPRVTLDFDQAGKLLLLRDLAHLVEEKDAPKDAAAKEFFLGRLRLKDASLTLRKPNGFWGFPSELGLDSLDLTLRNVGKNRPVEVEMEGRVVPYDFTIGVSGRTEPSDFSDLASLAYRGRARITGLRLGPFEALLREYDVPVQDGTLDMDTDVWSQGRDDLHLEGSVAVQDLKPQNTSLRARYRLGLQEKAVSVESAELEVEPFEVATLEPLLAKLGLPKIEGTASLDADLDGKPSAWASRGTASLTLRAPRAVELAVDYDAALSDEGERLDIKHLSVSTKAADISVRGSVASLSSKAPKLNLELSAKNTRLEEAAALSEAGLLGGVDFSSLKGRADAEVKASGTTKKPLFSGKASLVDFSVRTDYLAAPIAFPRLEAAFEGETFTLEPVHLALGETSFEGRVVLEGLDAPDINFALRSPELDIGKLFALLPAEDTQAEPAPSPETPSQTESPLKKTTLRGTFETPKALYGGLTFTDVKASVRMERGLFHVEPLSLVLYQGRADHLFEMNLTSDVLPFRLASTLEGVDIKQMVESATEHKDLLKGRLFMKLDAKGEGFEEGAMGKRLRGQSHFEVKDGALTSFSLLEQIRKVGGLVGIKEGIDPNTTRFDVMDGDFKIGGRRFTTENTRLVSEDLDSRVRGSMDFEGNLDFHVTTYLSKELTAQIKESDAKTFFTSDDGRATIPAYVKGTIYEPKTTLDMEFIRKRVQKEVKKEIKKKIFGIFGGD